MEKSLKRFSYVTGFLFALALAFTAVFAGFAFADRPRVTADTTASVVAREYYRDELKNSELALRFYDVMEEIADGGHFSDGAYRYDLSEVLTQNELAEYLGGNSPKPKIPAAFGAARDAFYMDHPDLFYVDVYKLYLTAGMQGGRYIAYVDSGNADNYFTDNTVSSAAEVETAVAAYESAITQMVDGAKAAGTDAAKQIEYVNDRLATEVAYDYGAYENAVHNIVYDGYVNTAYGALVNNKAMCGGYSRAFKAVMDRLDIPCVLIQGVGYTGKSVTVASGEDLQPGFEAHMWNAVFVDGQWYGVDVTWNSGAPSKDKYMLVGEEIMSIAHFEDGVISSSGFELKYPALCPFNYGSSEDASGFAFKFNDSVGGKEFGYFDYTDPDTSETQKFLRLGVSYEGKNAVQLLDEGKYLALRYCTNDTWGMWFGVMASYEFLGLEVADVEENFIAENFTINELSGTVQRVQYAVMDVEPNKDYLGIKYIYDLDVLDSNCVLAYSTVFTNDAYLSYVPAPYVKKMTPDEKGSIKSFAPITITLEYSEELVFVDEDEEVGVSVTAAHDDIGECIKVSETVWNAETNTLSFRFTPSTKLRHNNETYYYAPTNLVGKRSGKTPEPAGLTFKRQSIVCPKVFNDGRLYMKVFGEPQFVGAEDMSLTGFKDKNGQPVVGNQRSQLMLVVNEPSEDENRQMEEALPAEDRAAIAASSTYQIDLQLCGFIQKVPDRSYMQVGFGFPDGYGPESAGVTFTVYHYTRNPDGTVKSVEKVPCLVTEYGIIATVQSFSPFMICAVETDEATASRNVYASVKGVGGTIDRTKIETVNNGQSVSYTLTADSGYTVNKVLLNGEDITATLNGNTLTVDYSALGGGAAVGNSDVIEVTFISERVSADNTAKGLEVISPVLVVTSEDMIQAVAHDPVTPPTPQPPTTDVPGADPASDGGSKTGIIVAVVVVVIVLAAAAAVATVLIMRKKKTAEAGNAASKSVKTENTKKAAKPDKASASVKKSQSKKDPPAKRK